MTYRLFGQAAVALLATATLLTFGGTARAQAWGAIKGQVVKEGNPPAPAQINVNKDPQHCLSKGPLFSEELVVNPQNKGVRWVFVWLQPVPGGPPLAVNPALQQVKDKQVFIDQPCCQFVPHALAMRQGQELVAKNSAPIAHNVHWTGYPLKNPGGNQIVPAGGEVVIKGLQTDRFPVEIKCDIHGWMKAWVRVFDHPYFAVTDENGDFEIKDAPAGNFALIVWQESIGWVGGKTGTPITVQAGQTTNVGKIKM